MTIAKITATRNTWVGWGTNLWAGLHGHGMRIDKQRSGTVSYVRHNNAICSNCNENIVVHM